MANTNLLAGSANRDAQLGMQLRMARIAHEQKQRDTMMMLLRKIAEDRQAKKAAAKQGGSGALAGGAIGAIGAGLLAIPTGGLSLAALPAITAGASLGATVGGAYDQSQGGQPSNLGGNLMDFSTGIQRNQALYGDSVSMAQYGFEAPYPSAPYPSPGGFPGM